MGKFKVGDSLEFIEKYGSYKIGDKVTMTGRFDGNLIFFKGKKGNGTALESRFKLSGKSSKNQRLTSLEERVSTLEEIAQQLQENNITIDDVKKYFTLPSTVELDGKQLSAASIIGMTIESSAVNSPFGTEVGRDLEAEYVEQARVEEDYKVHDEVIEFEGNMYQKVGREAREGDVVVFEGVLDTDTENNIPYKVYKIGNVLRYDNGKTLGNMVYGWETHCPNPSIYELIQPSTTTTVEDKQDVHSTTFTLGGKHSDDHNAVQDVQRQTVPCAAAKTPNELRAEVIEKAKEFVKKHLTNAKYGYGVVGNNTTPRTTERGPMEYKFVVNEEKRTIVALGKLYWTGHFKDEYKGIAKCNPSDVFNEHIGKAIALGRALGLDVSEFEQAVQPTEKVIGQVVYVDGRKAELKPYTFDAHIAEGTVTLNSHYGRVGVIINDTNAIYGGVE